MESKVYHSAHLAYLCRYHVVFCPKYRRKILTSPLDEFVKKTFLEIANAHQFKILEMEIMPDHVHLLIECNPRFGIMSCIARLKAESTSKMRTFEPSLSTRLPTIWTRAAFIATVGSVSLETVKKYTESQKNV